MAAATRPPQGGADFSVNYFIIARAFSVRTCLFPAFPPTDFFDKRLASGIIDPPLAGGMFRGAKTMTQSFSLLATTALSALLITGAATDAKAVPIQNDSSFSINGVFTYEPELTQGTALNFIGVSRLTEGEGTFAELLVGTNTTPVDSLIYSTGSDNVGLSFTVDYDDGGGNAGVFRFTVGETVATPIVTVDGLNSFRISGLISVEDSTGYYDTTEGAALFAGTFAPMTGVGTYSASFLASPAPIPVPAALPLLIGGIGALGALGKRRRRNAAI